MIVKYFLNVSELVLYYNNIFPFSFYFCLFEGKFLTCQEEDDTNRVRLVNESDTNGQVWKIIRHPGNPEKKPRKMMTRKRSHEASTL
jgi:hypothetical protein